MREFISSFSGRFSFCCHACRTRTTPTSVRFLGRRVYLALMVVLSSSRHAGSNSGAQILASGLQVPVRTLERWRIWWTQTFIRTPLWCAGAGAFMPPLVTDRLPTSLLERFVGVDAAARLSNMLRFVRPLTARPVKHRVVVHADHAA